MREIKSNEPTKYEVAIVNNATGEKYLLFYKMRKSRMALYEAAAGRGEEIVRLCGLGDDAQMKVIDAKKWETGIAIVGTDWAVKYTGRTMRDIRGDGLGELKFICEIMPAVQTLAQQS